MAESAFSLPENNPDHDGLFLFQRKQTLVAMKLNSNILRRRKTKKTRRNGQTNRAGWFALVHFWMMPTRPFFFKRKSGWCPFSKMMVHLWMFLLGEKLRFSKTQTLTETLLLPSKFSRTLPSSPIMSFSSFFLCSFPPRMLMPLLAPHFPKCS